LPLVNVLLVNILDALDAASRLDIEMGAVFAEEVRVVRNDPTTVDVLVKPVVAFDPREYGPIFPPHVLGIAVRLHFCLFAVRKRILFGALAPKFGRGHAGAIGIESAAGPVNHVMPNEPVKLWINGLIWNFAGHNFIHSLRSPRLVGIVLQDQEDVRMRQPALLKKKRGSVEIAFLPILSSVPRDRFSRRS
jgi:hypothetical protein